jgi:hypothetical protein
MGGSYDGTTTNNKQQTTGEPNAKSKRLHDSKQQVDGKQQTSEEQKAESRDQGTGIWTVDPE